MVEFHANFEHKSHVWRFQGSVDQRLGKFPLAMTFEIEGDDNSPDWCWSCLTTGIVGVWGGELLNG